MSVDISRYVHDVYYQIGVDHARRLRPQTPSYDQWVAWQQASYDAGRSAVEPAWIAANDPDNPTGGDVCARCFGGDHELCPDRQRCHCTNDHGQPQ